MTISEHSESESSSLHSSEGGQSSLLGATNSSGQGPKLSPNVPMFFLRNKHPSKFVGLRLYLMHRHQSSHHASDRTFHCQLHKSCGLPWHAHSSLLANLPLHILHNVVTWPNMSAPPRRCWVGNAASSVCAVGQRTHPAEVQSEPHLPSDVVLGQLVTERIGLENGIVLSFSS